VPENPTGIRRMLHLFSFMLGSIPVMLREIFYRPQVVFTVEPAFFGVPLALLTAWCAEASSWLHIQDFESDAAFELGLLPAGGSIHAIAMALERWIMGGLTRVSSISIKMVERIALKGVDPSRAVLFPNWVDIEQVHPLEGENGFRQELGLTGKMIVLYSGNMGNKQGLELLAPLANSFAPLGHQPDPSVHFVFCGNGAFRPQLEALVGHLENVTMLPLQPLERLNELLNMADIHLLPQRAGAADLVMPSKLTGMLASGRPVIATADAGTQVALVIENDGLPCGIVVPAEAPDALHTAVADLAASQLLRKTMGSNARDYAVQNLGREQVLLQFERDLCTLVGPSASSPQVI